MTLPENHDAASRGESALERGVRPRAWALFAPNGNFRIWSTVREEVERVAAEAVAPVTPLYDEAALVDVLRLAEFGAWAAREFRESLADVDGGSAQDAMERLGVIEKHAAPEPCGDGCVCVEYGEFPHDCYRFAPGVARLVNPGA